MHIPDGYLSPGTCVTLYAAAAPFWLVTLRRIRRSFASRSIPLLAVFSALSFTVMMFNVPLPGGTTGHAVGLGITSAVLGPSLSILAISTALFIQALLFGDGGLTTFGANCFNMAIVGSLVSFAAYRLLSIQAPLSSYRRTLAAGLGGYLGINAAALCAAIEFGIQPLYFHDAAGVPLYAPYGLAVTIPAMMIGHLTFAGLAEFVLSAGVVAFLQQSDRSLLQSASGRTPMEEDPEPWSEPLSDRRPKWAAGSKRLWIVLSILLALTPIGIVAAGTAWGEWLPEDYVRLQTRSKIVAASRNSSLPAAVPQGLERLSGLWLAPLSGYASPVLKNRFAAYMVAGLIGAGAVILAASLVMVVAPRMSRASPGRKSFLESTVDRLAWLVEESLYAEQNATRSGLLQRLDPRVKLAGVIALITAAIAANRMLLVAALLALSSLLAINSRISPARLVRRVWLPVFAFTGAIALPALFLLGGHPVWRVPLISVTVTQPGLHTAALLLLRALTSATAVFLLVATVPWNRLLRALRFFRIPAGTVVAIEMSHRYFWVLLRSAREMFESRRTRSLGPLSFDGSQQLASSAAGALLSRSVALSSDVHLAMQARGFRGEVLLLEEDSLSASGRLQLILIVAVGILAVYAGR